MRKSASVVDGESGDGLVVGAGGIAVAFLAAQDVAERPPDVGTFGIGPGELFEHLDPRLGSSRRDQRIRPADFGGDIGRIVVRDLRIGLDRKVVLPLRFEDLRDEKQHFGIPGREVFGHPGIGQGVDVRTFALQRRGDREEDLRQPVGGVSDDVEGDRLARLELGPEPGEGGVGRVAHRLVDQFDRGGVAFELAEDFGRGQHAAMGRFFSSRRRHTR